MWQYIISMGVGSAGLISALFAFWRKAKLETKVKDLESKNLALKAINEAWDVLNKTIINQNHASEEKFNTEIALLKTQRATALAAVDRCDAPGALRGVLRASLGIPDDGLSKPS